MPIVRILVDGYSLLHAWPELLPGSPPHAARSREELIRRLTRYHDAVGTPLTLFFDGQGAPPGTPRPHSSRQVEVLYSRRGRTADDLIERTTFRLLPFGPVLVVTDDLAERDTVMGLGGLVSGCGVFIDQVNQALGDSTADLRHHNRREQEQFRSRLPFPTVPGRGSGRES